MRKTMTKEVTKTIAKLKEVVNQDGNVSMVDLDDLVLIGNVSREKVQRKVHKELNTNVVVISVEVSTETYEMPVDEFIKHATLKAKPEETV